MTRKKFEQEMSSRGRSIGAREGHGYADRQVDLLWQIWQASRKEALEDAAEEAGSWSEAYMDQARGGDNSGASDHKADAAKQIADDIRTMNNPEGDDS